MNATKSTASSKNALKTLSETDDELRVANYLALFNSKDLSGEWFAEDTDFSSKYTGLGRFPLDWEHGLGHKWGDGMFGPDPTEPIGFVDWKTSRKDKIGIWVERVLNRRNRYVAALEKLIKDGLIGSSSEALSYMVQILRSGKIARWPLMADSLTVMPMEPRMVTENSVGAIKSAVEALPGVAKSFQETWGNDALIAAGIDVPASLEADDSTKDIESVAMRLRVRRKKLRLRR